MTRTHIEVTAANEGGDFFGIKTGQLLAVERETPAYIYAKLPRGGSIQISKKTKRFAGRVRAVVHGVARKMTVSPVFNV